MNRKTLFFSLLTVILLFVFIYFVFFLIEKRTEKIEKTEDIENKIKLGLQNFSPSFVDDCENIMLKEDLTYAICCLSPENKIYRCDKTSFKPGEYIGIQINLQKLNNPFPNYYTCVFTDLPIYQTIYPLKYKFVSEQKLLEPAFVCSPLFYSNDYHHQALSGFISNKQGSFSLKIWFFDGNYPRDFDFQNNLEKGMKVFDLTFNIK